MNRQIRLRTVRRPEAGAGHIGQRVVVGRLDLRDAIHGLSTVGSAEEAIARVVKDRTFLEVVRPIRDGNRVAARSVRFDRVLVDR